MALNSIIQDLKLVTEKMADIDMNLLDLPENQQKDFRWTRWACLKGIEKIEKMKQGIK